MKRSLLMTSALLALAAALAAAGCGRNPGGATPGGHEEHAESATGGAHGAESAEAGAHDHEAEAAEPSDLDLPVDELFDAACEHGVKTHACDECRYEVGVVKAPAALFDGGLLHAVTPEREAVRVPLDLTGEVRFDERRVAHLSPPAPGLVRRVAVVVGDRVRRGDTLLEIESGEAGAAAAELREARSLLTLAEGRHERQRRLREQGIAAEKDFLQAEQELESARIRLEAATAQASRLGAAGDGTAGTLRLRASVDGTVLFLHAVGGEQVGPEQVVATIGDLATVWVWADLYERDLSRLPAAGSAPLPAEVTARAWPGQAFPGTVDFISPSIDEGSRTVKLRVTVPNPDGRLLAGMFAGVRVFLPGDGQALAVPRDAVLEDEGRRFVFVHHHDDYYVRRPVTVGRAWGERIEITDGLRGDETIVAGGSFLLKSDVLRSKMGAGCAD